MRQFLLVCLLLFTVAGLSRAARVTIQTDQLIGPGNSIGPFFQPGDEDDDDDDDDDTTDPNAYYDRLDDLNFDSIDVLSGVNGESTEVTVVTGGSIAPQVNVRDDSSLILAGGQLLGNLNVRAEAQILLSSGKMQGGRIHMHGQSRAVLGPGLSIDTYGFPSVLRVLDESQLEWNGATSVSMLGVQVRQQGRLAFNTGSLTTSSDHAMNIYDAGNLVIKDGLIEAQSPGPHFPQFDAVRGRGESSIAIDGGTLRGSDDGVDLAEYSQVVMQGGTVLGQNDGFKVKDQSELRVIGDSIIGRDDGLSLANQAHATIKGGTIEGGAAAVRVIDRGSVRIDGGTFVGPIVIQDQASVNLTDGDFSAIRFENGGRLNIFYQLDARGLAVLANGRSTNSIPIDFRQGGAMYQYQAIESKEAFDQLDRNAQPDLALIAGAGSAPEIDTTRPLFSLYLADDAKLTIRNTAGRIDVDDFAQLTVAGATVDQLTTRRQGAVRAHDASLGATWIGDQTNVVVERTMIIDRFGQGYSVRVTQAGQLTLVDSQLSRKMQVEDDAIVTILGGQIDDPGLGIQVTGNGKVTVQGTQISAPTSLLVSENGHVHLQNGTFNGTQGARLMNAATMQMDGGRISNHLQLRDDSMLKLAGGILGTDLIAQDHSIVNMIGGTISDDLRATDHAHLNLNGGTVVGDVELRDFTLTEMRGTAVTGTLELNEEARLRLLGRNLALEQGHWTGRLLAGAPLPAHIVVKDQAALQIYETFQQDASIAPSFPTGLGLAAVDGKEPARIILNTKSTLSGGLYAGENSEVEVRGGDIRGLLHADGNGKIHLLFRDLEKNTIDLESVDPMTGLVTKTKGSFSGVLVDGTRVNVPYEAEGDGAVIPYTTVTKNETISDARWAVAVLGEEVEPVNVQFVEGALTSAGLRLLGNARVDFFASAAAKSTAVTLRDTSRFHMTGGGVWSWDDEGIWAQESSEVVIDAFYFGVSGDRDGIRVWDSSRLEVNSSVGTIVANADDAIDVDQQGIVMLRRAKLTGGNDGLKAKQQSRVTAFAGSITGNDDGMSFSGDALGQLHAVRLQGGRNGLHAVDDSRVEVLGGLLSGGVNAIELEDDATVHLYGGRLSGNILAHGGELHVYGNQLAIESGMLRGRLADGSRLELPVISFGNLAERIVLHEGVLHPVDFDADGTLDAGDIDLLAKAFRAGATDPKYDLNQSNTVDSADADFLVYDYLFSRPGDANLDGRFDSSDLVTVFAQGHFEDRLAANSGWAQGDWNYDLEFDSADLVLGLQAGLYQQVPVASVPVPEPSAMNWFGVMIDIVVLSVVKTHSFNHREH